MKTKNFLLAVAFLIVALFSVNSVMAETTPPTPVTTQTSDNVTLNIVLNPIQTIVVNSAEDHKTVKLEYSTWEHYNKGVEAIRQNHLTVYSTGAFNVTVSSTGLEPTGRILPSNITLVVNANIGEYTNEQTLASTDALITSETGGRNLEYGVTYKMGGEDTFNSDINLSKVENFTTQVTYTIAAK